jgi:hypothetical protein
MDDLEKRSFLTLPELELRPLGHPARSQSLYWHFYPYNKMYCARRHLIWNSLFTCLPAQRFVLHCVWWELTRTDRKQKKRMSYDSVGSYVTSLHQWFHGPLLGHGLFISFLIFYTVGRTPWTGDQPVARPLPTHRKTQTQNKYTHRHSCLEWYSNPWSQRSSERR